MKRRLEIRGASFAVDVIGEGQPLLLLHGFTGSGAVFEPFYPTWGAQFQLIVPDLLGHGESDAPTDSLRYTMEETLLDLVCMLDLLDVANANVLGYSMGGRIALGFAVSFPERIRRLVLEGTSPGLQSESERIARRQSDERLAERIERDGVVSFVKHWEAIPLFATQHRLAEETLTRQRGIREGGTALGYANSLRGIGTGHQPSYWDTLQTLAVPTLLVTGELDEKFTETNRRMQAVLPNARHCVISDAGHTPHLEHPATFSDCVVSFLNARDC